MPVTMQLLRLDVGIGRRTVQWAMARRPFNSFLWSRLTVLLCTYQPLTCNSAPETDVKPALTNDWKQVPERQTKKMKTEGAKAL